MFAEGKVRIGEPVVPRLGSEEGFGEPVVPRLVDALRGDVVANQINGVLRHDDVLRLHLENLCNGARVFVLALHQQLILVFADADDHRFVQ